MSAYAIGTVFKRREPQSNATDEIRVVGSGNGLVVTPHQDFGSPYSIDMKTLRSEYVLEDGTELEEPEVETTRSKMSPLEVFAAQERKDARDGTTPEPVKRGGRRGTTQAS